MQRERNRLHATQHSRFYSRHNVYYTAETEKREDALTSMRVYLNHRNEG